MSSLSADDGVTEQTELDGPLEHAKAVGLDYAIGSQEANDWALPRTRMLAVLREIPESVRSNSRPE